MLCRGGLQYGLSRVAVALAISSLISYRNCLSRHMQGVCRRSAFPPTDRRDSDAAMLQLLAASASRSTYYVASEVRVPGGKVGPKHTLQARVLEPDRDPQRAAQPQQS